MDCARNIITANFSGGGTSATTAPLWQWDYGQALCITGIEDLPAAFEVHFSTNRTGGVSTVAVGADGQVTIPNVLLTIGKNLNAWIYLSDSKGEGETEYSILIPVKARPMPETYDAEVTGEFDDVVRQVSEYAQTAQTAADNAGASASAAAASASEAAASASAAETAKNAAETAQGKAEDAQTAAETAAQTATEKAQQTAQDAAQAAQSEADAESAAERAESAETGAESAKRDAETAAQDAAASASTATEKANLAGQAAASAAQSATAAAQSAASIEGDVQIASQKAAEAQTAADQAVAAKDAAVAAQQGAEAAETNAGQSASTATAKAAEAAQSASGAAQSKTDAEAAATRAEQAAASLTVDSALSDTSVNPVENRVITAEVTQVKTALNAIEKTEPINILANTAWVQGSIDPNNGSELTGSTRIKTGFIRVYAGDVIRFNVSDGYRYVIDYYNSSKEPITTERLHGLWQTIEQFIIVGSEVSYIRLLASTPTNSDISPSEGSAVSALQIYNLLPQTYSWTSGYYVNYSTGELVASASYEYTKINVSAFVGGTIKGITASPSNVTAGIAFYDVTDTYISGGRNSVSNTYGYNYSLVIPQNASYMLITREVNHRELWCDPELPWGVFINNISAVIDLERLPSHELTDPVITWVDNHYVNYATAVPTADVNYKYAKIPISMFRGGHISGVTGITPNTAQGIVFTDAEEKYVDGARNTTAGTYKFPYDLVIPNDASYILITLQKASESLWVAPTYPWDFVTVNLNASLNDVDDAGMIFEVEHKAKNARHAPGNPTLLTLLHFSDLHHDQGGALSRIVSDAEELGALVDDRICTGDMVGNTSEQIASWWDSSVMTCIGNHDTASYNASTGYDWTALSMADRDAYYIAPFESGWGITHTSGTSYYYKDYTTQKVRLIVMDAMLYSGTPGAEATTQTAWLANLLSDAITNNLHVLIAIHSPHGGATAKDCSFSRYGQGTMPTYSDCNTPQTVIDTVAAAITNGLHFIGYIVGHTHQDNIWDAEGDGRQLMYCVTCAAVNNPNQWKNSDQYRGVDADAYNLVTIDTTNTLVKIARGGGADIDDHMRTRKGICFNYTTGEIVGQVL